MRFPAAGLSWEKFSILARWLAGGKSNGILDISGDGEVELDKLMLCASKASAGSTACVNISGNGKLTVAGAMDMI